MPDARHFLFDLTDEDQRKFEDAMQQTATLARNDAVARMLEPLQREQVECPDRRGRKYLS